jgi:hypothetical protein
MLRNIPNNYTISKLANTLNREGFKGRYNAMYHPTDMSRNNAGLGYAFINFVSGEDALEFKRCFQGFKNWHCNSEKIGDTSKWATQHQGLDEFVNLYRNSPIMHEKVSDECKPRVFEDGVRVPFPIPTKELQEPKLSEKRFPKTAQAPLW